MKNVCRSWAQGTVVGLPAKTAALAVEPIETELKHIATTFVVLQDARHVADYDVRQTLNRRESAALVARSEQAFRDWSAVRSRRNASIFLAALLFEKQWKGR